MKKPMLHSFLFVIMGFVCLKLACNSIESAPKPWRWTPESVSPRRFNSIYVAHQRTLTNAPVLSVFGSSRT